MKLLRVQNDQHIFRLGDWEKKLLVIILDFYPVIPAAHHTVSKSPNAADKAHQTLLDEAMAEHIARALQLTQGRIEGPRGAAALLGINPHTLRARMRKLGLQWKRFRAVPTARTQV